MTSSAQQGFHVPVARSRPPAPVRNEVHRDRILNRLLSDDPPLIVVTAPAGYGKSTLAAQWLKRREHTAQPHPTSVTAWMGVGEDDNAPIRFMSHLIEVIDSAIPGCAEHLGAALEEHTDDIARWGLPPIVDWIHQSEANLSLVLDDWHLIKEPRCQEILQWLVDHPCEQVTILITSRQRIPLPLRKLKLDGRLREVGAASLRFDPEELAEFVHDSPATRFDSAARARLLEATDGWVAGLQLALLAYQDSQDTDEFLDMLATAPGEVSTYLAEVVFDGLPPDLLEILHVISVPERINAEFVNALTGRSDGSLLLSDISRRNLFLQAIDDNSEWYRFHHMFAATLRRRFAVVDPQRLHDTRIAAAQWLSAHNQPFDAVHQANKAPDPELAIDIVRTHAMNLVEHSRMSSLIALCELVPAHVRESDTELQLALAWANCLLHRAADAQYFLDLMSQEGFSQSQSIEASVIQACIDMYADAVEDIAPMQDVCFPYADSLRPWVVSVAANIATFVHLRAGDSVGVLKVQRWAHPYHRATTGPFSVVYGLLYSALAHRDANDVTRAQSYALHGYEVACSQAGSYSHAARLAGAVVASLTYARKDFTVHGPGDWYDVEKLCRNYCELRTEGGVVDFMIAGYLTLSRYYADRNRLDDANAVLDQALQVAHKLRLHRLATHVHLERTLLPDPSALQADAAPAYPFSAEDSGQSPGLAGDGDAGGVDREQEPSISDAATDDTEYVELSDREIEILALVRQGLSNRDIARRIRLGVNTVKWYLKNLFVKFDVSRRDDCVRAAEDAGFDLDGHA